MHKADECVPVAEIRRLSDIYKGGARALFRDTAMNDAAIGVFDSGMGGLSVMRALTARLAGESFIYLGDTARLPYGTKSGDTVTRYAVQAAGTLVKRRINVLVVACNTARAWRCRRCARPFAPLPVIDVIARGAEAALAASPPWPHRSDRDGGHGEGRAYARAIHARARRRSR